MTASPRRLVGALVLAVAVAACSSGPSAPDESTYLKEIADFRANKDRQFSEEPEPIPQDKRKTLLPLQYYAPDSTFSTAAVLKLSEDRPTFEMPTSTGQPRRMQRVGVLEFTLQGQTLTLGAFVEAGTQEIAQLFVPFADTTNGSETYPAGRYLDLHPTATNLYTIDFNRAYNPYCAYNQTYECPFPPPSNRLKVAIRAGEKVPRG